ncbi:MAG: DUF1638 domain-containing protein [Methanomassiliicoccales archaeon]|nr:DUF1638 domain-containing protein [Methanomassiliicoccales archaeon]
MRIGIVACEALKEEIESIVAGDPDFVHHEYLDFGLHLYPDELKSEIMKRLETLEGKVDAVFLGFAHCQALRGLPAMVSVPTAMLEMEDCLAAFLGEDVYGAEKHNGGITWFYPTGWARRGPDGIVKLFHLDSAKDQGYEPEYFLKIMFTGFKRCMYIDTGVATDGCRETTQALADRLGLRYVERCGTLNAIREAMLRTKDLAAGLTNPVRSGDANRVNAGAACSE